MTRRPLLLSLSIPLALASSAEAQIDTFFGASNNAGTVVDLDNPPAVLGPIASNDPYFTSLGIREVNIIGTWVVGIGDLLETQVFGQSLAVLGNQLTVSEFGDRIDEPTAGAGFEIVLAEAHDEVGFLITDQINHNIRVELFNGQTSLGATTVLISGVPNYFRAGQKADRVVVTYPNGSRGQGFDNIFFADGPPPPPAPVQCLESSAFIGGLGGNPGLIGGAIYFDLTATQPVNFAEITTHYNTPAGSAVGIEVWTTPDTFRGKEGDQALWTLAALDDGNAVSAGYGQGSVIHLTNPISLPLGTTGVALVAVGSPHCFSNPNGSNEVRSSGDGILTYTAGPALNTAFSIPIPGTNLWDRVWNGVICHNLAVGSTYCDTYPNSTGMPGSISATGSADVAQNDLTLTASNLPAGQFGIFVVGDAQAQSPLQQGFICVGGTIGRYQQPGQIQRADATGKFSLQVDLAAIPQGFGLVAALPGDTYHFQGWHRDLAGGLPTSNLTHGLAITFR